MADIIDTANDRAQSDLDRAIAAVRSRRQPVANGSCYYCHEDVEPGRLYCDTACAEDHETEKRIRARQGAR